MIRKGFSIFNVIVFLGLLIINVWIYIHRNDGFAYTDYATNNRLYLVSENPRISDFNLLSENKLSVTIKKDTQRIRSILNLIEGNQHYKTIVFNDTVLLTIDYTKAIDYTKNQRNRNDVVEIRDCSIPLFSSKLKSIKEWQQLSVFETQEEINLVRKIIHDSLKISGKDSSVIKIRKLAHYLSKQVDNNTGIPSDSMNDMSPYNQLQFVKQKKSKLWCGNFADIFSFYAKCAGLTTRLVCLEGKWNASVYKAGHSFNEVYLPEYKQWAFVDLTSNTVLVQSSSQHYLNSIEFYNLYQLAPQSIITTVIDNDSIKKMNFNLSQDFYQDYFEYNNRFVFYKSSFFNSDNLSLIEKAKRYFSKQATFSVYADAQDTSNTKFYVKQNMAILLVLFCMYWMTSCFLLKRQKIKS